MTSSTSCSGSVRVPLVVLAVACLAGCASLPAAAGLGGGPGEPVQGSRVLVLPPENLATAVIASKEVTSRMEQMVVLAGADVIGGERLDEYLAKYRIRYTGRRRPGGREGRAGGDLGADAILVTSVLLWSGRPRRWPW